MSKHFHIPLRHNLFLSSVGDTTYSIHTNGSIIATFPSKNIFSGLFTLLPSNDCFAIKNFHDHLEIVDVKKGIINSIYGTIWPVDSIFYNNLTGTLITASVHGLQIWDTKK